MRSFKAARNLLRTNHQKQNTEERRIGKEMSCPQETVNEHAGPCKFLILCITFIFSVALKSLSMPLPFFLIIFPFSH